MGVRSNFIFGGPNVVTRLIGGLGACHEIVEKQFLHSRHYGIRCRAPELIFFWAGPRFLRPWSQACSSSFSRLLSTPLLTVRHNSARTVYSQPSNRRDQYPQRALTPNVPSPRGSSKTSQLRPYYLVSSA